MEENHYQALGLELTASNSAIRNALDRLAEQARLATREDPERARSLWNRVRAVRKDLLSGRETRESYDLALLSSMPAQAVPVPVPERYVRPDRPRVVAAQPEPRRWPLVVAGTGAVLLALLVAVVFANRPTSNSASPSHPVSISGTVASGSSFESGKPIDMQWSPVKGATKYRLDLWTSNGARHKLIELSRPSYRTTVMGAQKYFWRVKALVQGRWSGYGATSHFEVAAPVISRVAALRIPEASALRPGRPVTLCWKPVSKAIGYRVVVTGAAPRTVRTSCTRLTLGAGRHVWKVSAEVRGAKSYLGPPKSGSFVVRRPRRVVIARATTRRQRLGLVAAAQPLRAAPSTSRTTAVRTSPVVVSVPVRHTLTVASRPTRRSPSIHRVSGTKSPTRTKPSTGTKAPRAGSRPHPTAPVRQGGPPPPPPPPPAVGPSPSGRTPAPASHTPAPLVYAPTSKTVAQPTHAGVPASSPPSLPSRPTAVPTPVTVVQPTEPPAKKTCPGKSCEAHGRGRGKNHPHP